MLNSVADHVDAKIANAVKKASEARQSISRLGRPARVFLDFTVYGEPNTADSIQAVTYLQDKGLKVDFVNIADVAFEEDSSIHFDASFLPVVVDAKTGKVFISNPATANGGFEAWRKYID